MARTIESPDKTNKSPGRTIPYTVRTRTGVRGTVRRGNEVVSTWDKCKGKMGTTGQKGTDNIYLYIRVRIRRSGRDGWLRTKKTPKIRGVGITRGKKKKRGTAT